MRDAAKPAPQLPDTIDKFAKEEIETPNHSKP
jgi:hypothetical protein